MSSAGIPGRTASCRDRRPAGTDDQRGQASRPQGGQPAPGATEQERKPMNRHLNWSELDAYIRGRMEGPQEVHLAECGECAEKLTLFRDEERAIRDALAVGEVAEDEIERVVEGLPDPALRTGPRPSWTGLVPLLAASLLVGLLILLLNPARPPRP